MVAGDELIALAVVVGTHGLQGELKVKLYNPDSALLQETQVLWLRGQGEPRQLRVEGRRLHSGRLLMRLSGCNGREAAEALRGSELCLPRNELPPLEEGEYYLADLVGLTARLPDGSELGPVEEILNYPTSDVLVVATPQGIIEIPAMPPYVVEVEVQIGRLVVDQVDELEPRKPGRRRRK